MHRKQSLSPEEADACNVKVFLRVRPMNGREQREGSHEVVSAEAARREITVTPANGNRRLSKTFTFDGAFGPDSTQAQVYKEAVRPVVDEMLKGYNCTIFAYGQTGTGKTYTMEGGEPGSDVQSDAHWKTESVFAGVIPRAIHHIFTSLDAEGLASGEVEHAVRVSHLELYNEELNDLLAVEDRQLKLYDDGNRGVRISNLEDVLVQSSDDICSILAKSASKRRTASTNLNHNSSRSHCVFTITIHTKETTQAGEDLIRIGKLNLVDLAGSENVGRSGAKDKRQREAGNINQSLLTLGRVITSLTDNHGHVPYRESKLTRLLQESLGGRAKTSIIATVSPSSQCVEETLSTLDYAHRAKNIKNIPQVNQKMTKRALIRDYERDIERLKGQLTAARLQNGVYLPPDEYESLQREIKGSTETVAHLESRLELKENELRDQLELQRTTQQALGRKRDQLRATQGKLDAAESRLRQRSQELAATRNVLLATESVVQEREATLARFAEQHAGLVDTLDDAQGKIGQLHGKLERGAQVEQRNRTAGARFQEQVDRDVEQVARRLAEFQAGEQDHLDQLREQVAQFSEARRGELARLRHDAQQFRSLLEDKFEVVQRLAHEHRTGAVAQLAESGTARDAFTGELEASAQQFVATAQAAMDQWKSSLAAERDELAQWRQHQDEQLAAQQARLEAFATAEAAQLCELQAALDAAMAHQTDRACEQQQTLRSFAEAHAEQTAAERRRLEQRVAGLLQEFEAASGARVQQALERAVAERAADAEHGTASRLSLVEQCTRAAGAVAQFREDADADARAERDDWRARQERLLTLVGAGEAQGEQLDAAVFEHTGAASQLAQQFAEADGRRQAAAEDAAKKFMNQHNWQLESLQTDVSRVVNGMAQATEAQEKEVERARDLLADAFVQRAGALGDFAVEHTEAVRQVNGRSAAFVADQEYLAPTGRTPQKRAIGFQREPPAPRKRQDIVDEYFARLANGEPDAAAAAKKAAVDAAAAAQLAAEEEQAQSATPSAVASPDCSPAAEGDCRNSPDDDDAVAPPSDDGAPDSAATVDGTVSDATAIADTPAGERSLPATVPSTPVVESVPDKLPTPPIAAPVPKKAEPVPRAAAATASHGRKQAAAVGGSGVGPRRVRAGSSAAAPHSTVSTAGAGKRLRASSVHDRENSSTQAGSRTSSRAPRGRPSAFGGGPTSRSSARSRH